MGTIWYYRYQCRDCRQFFQSEIALSHHQLRGCKHQIARRRRSGERRSNMAQHVTFFRMKVTPGKLDELVALMADEPANMASSGFEAAIMGKSKDDPNTVWAAVSWDTSERYYANAERPEQNAEYEKMRALLEADPEWFDCDVLQEIEA